MSNLHSIKMQFCNMVQIYLFSFYMLKHDSRVDMQFNILLHLQSELRSNKVYWGHLGHFSSTQILFQNQFTCFPQIIYLFSYFFLVLQNCGLCFSHFFFGGQVVQPERNDEAGVTASRLFYGNARHKRGLPWEQVMIHSMLKLCSSQLIFIAYSAVTEWSSDGKIVPLGSSS